MRKRTGLLSLGMLVAGLAFTGWYASRTVLDTERTERVAHAVLTDATIRAFLAERIEPVLAQRAPAAAAALTAQAEGAAPAVPGQPAGIDAASVQSQLATVLADPAIQRDLETFIGDLHRVVIGEMTGPVTLAQSDVFRLVVAAAPSTPPDTLAAIPPISFDPPVTPINGLRAAGAHWWWLIGLGGIALVATALAMSEDRRSNVRTIGTWLIGLSLVQLLVLWLIPVHVVPAMTDNVWALTVSKVAEALNGGLVIGLFVILGIGIVCRFANLFMRDPTRPTTSPVR